MTIVQYAHDLLEAGLSHPEWLIRFSASESLALCQDDRGMNCLLDALKHQQAILRDRAVQALGVLTSNIIIDDLRILIEDDDLYVRGHVLIALSKHMPADIIDILAGGLRDKNDFVKECAINALSSINNNDSFALLEAVARGQEISLKYPLRLMAANFLALKNKDSGLQILKETLDCGNQWVAFLAACKLAHLGYSDGLALIQLAVKEGDWQEKITATKALLALDKPLDDDGIIFRPSERPDVFERIDAALVLKNVELLSELIQQALESSNEEEQIHAIRAIGSSGIIEFLPLTENILLFGKEHIRAEIVMVVETLADFSLVPFITPILEKSHWLLRLQAARVVCKLHPKT